MCLAVLTAACLQTSAFPWVADGSIHLWWYPAYRQWVCSSIGLLPAFKQTTTLFMASAGGTFALYSLICRFAGMRPANNGVPDASDVTLSHYRSAQLVLIAVFGSVIQSLLHNHVMHSCQLLTQVTLLTFTFDHDKANPPASLCA